MNRSATARTDAHTPAVNEGGYIAVHLVTLRVDTIPDFNLFTRIGDRYVLYRSGDHPFTDRQRRRLVDHRVAWLYVPVADAPRYWAYVERHIPAILGDDSLPIEGKTRLFHRFSRKAAREVILDPGAAESLRKASDVVRSAAALLLEGKERLHLFMQMIGRDGDLFSHSVNVCTYGIALARSLGLPDERRLRELGLGLLLHDVGMTRVPRRILEKKGSLDYGEWDIVRAHPTMGVEIFSESRGIPGESLRVIQTHHERIDGSGYPRGLQGEEIPVGGRMACVADVFDALTTDRPHRPAVSTFEALRAMSAEMRGAFDPTLLATFVRNLGR